MRYLHAVVRTVILVVKVEYVFSMPTWGDRVPALNPPPVPPERNHHHHHHHHVYFRQ